jgi:purine-binding chemotaxis protein CheW
MKERRSIDWQAARASLAQTQQRLERADVPDEVRTRILRQRAEALARPAAVAVETGREQQIMVFWLDKERFALPLATVTEVLPAASIAPVPGAPPSVAGVMQIRGEIRPVFQLKELLGATGTGAGDTIILVRHRGREIGLRVGSVEEIRTLTEEDFQPQPDSNPRIRHLTADLVQVLDPDSLLNEILE